MRSSILAAAVLFAVAAATPATAQSRCKDHTEVTQVRVWDEVGSTPLVRDTASMRDLCFYYVNRTGVKDQPIILEFTSAKAVSQVDVNPVSSVVLVEGIERTGNVYKQTLVLSEHSASYRFTLKDSAGNRVDEIRLHAPRRSVFTLRPPTTNCVGEAGCLVEGRANLVQITGANLDQIDLEQQASSRGGERFPISLDDGNWFVTITPGQNRSIPDSVFIPLRVGVASTDTGKFTMVWSRSAPLVATVSNVRPVLELHSGNGHTPVTLAYAGSVLNVRFDSTGNKKIAIDTNYSLVEIPQDTAAPLATLSPYANDPTSGWRLARLRLNAPSRLPTLPGNPPLLYLMNGKEIVGTTTLAVRPRPRVERAEVVRGATVSQNLILHPAETATVYLTGPSVSAFDTVYSADPQVSVRRTEPVPGRLQLTITTPRIAMPFYEVRLLNAQGMDTLIRFESRPQQRPRPLNFGRIQWAAGNMDGTRLDSVGAIDPLRSLEGTRLVFDPSSVDDESGVYGVQYLLLKAKLVDHAGAVVDSSVYRFAIRPASDLPYTVEGGYVQTSEIDLDALLSESTLRTKAHSRLILSLQHDPERYPGLRTPAPVSAQMQHKGKLVIEPSFTLPTGMYVVADGFSPGLATMLGGAFLDFTYFPFAESRKPWPFTARAGIIAVDPTFLPPGHQRAKLAPTALLNYTIATVRRNLTLGVSGGVMYLNRHTANHWLENEDFFLLFSPGLSYTVK